MVKGIGRMTLVIAATGIIVSSAAANDQDVRTAIKQFQPALKSAGQRLDSALKSKPTPAGFASLDAATRRLLATLKLDHASLANTQASTPKVATGRRLLLTALTRLSQAVAALDRGLQAAKVNDKPAAVRELTDSGKEFRKAEAGEIAAAKLIGGV